jgi:ABC-2 type transport system ATP-binding protein
VIRRTAKEIVAVDDVSFAIEEGELFGLLGPNGAGKTTTVKMLTTLLIPARGSASVKGFDIVKQADEVRKRIGFIFGGERGLYWRLSGIDNLRYFASLYSIEPEVTKKRIPHLLEMVGLSFSWGVGCVDRVLLGRGLDGLFGPGHSQCDVRQ